jgi:acyl-CoA-binding protein
MKLAPAASAADVLLASQPANFRLAASYVLAHKSAIPMTQRLVLYALYKQTIDGDAPEAPSSWAQIIELAKHAVWSRYRGMSADEARKKWAPSTAHRLMRRHDWQRRSCRLGLHRRTTG